MKVAGIFAALLGASSFAVNLVFARKASLEGFTPSDMMLYPLLVLLVVLGIVLAVRGEGAMVPRHAWGIIMAMGALTAVSGLCFFLAVKYIAVSLAAMVIYSFPLIVLLMTPFVEKRPLPMVYFLLFSVAFGGLALVVAPSFDDLNWRGLLSATMATLLTAIQFFVMKRATAKVSALKLMFYGHIVALPLVLGAALFIGGFSSYEKMSHSPWLVCVICGGYMLGYFMQLVASQRLSPALSGLIFCFEPVVALFMAFVVLGESLAAIQQAGALVVIGVLLFTSLLDLRKPQL